MKILIADDDISFSLVMEEIFKKVDYEVETAVDGEETLKKIKEFKPDIVLLDVVMPKKDGFEILKEIKSNPNTKNIKVILCTGVSTVEIDKGFALGADDCVYKPFDAEFILKRIKRIFEK